MKHLILHLGLSLKKSVQGPMIMLEPALKTLMWKRLSLEMRNSTITFRRTAPPPRAHRHSQVRQEIVRDEGRSLDAIESECSNVQESIGDESTRENRLKEMRCGANYGMSDVEMKLGAIKETRNKQKNKSKRETRSDSGTSPKLKQRYSIMWFSVWSQSHIALA
ncbi:hypothetical protein YC2023_083963 [Brassica napus]